MLFVRLLCCCLGLGLEHNGLVESSLDVLLHECDMSERPSMSGVELVLPRSETSLDMIELWSGQLDEELWWTISKRLVEKFGTPQEKQVNDMSLLDLVYGRKTSSLMSIHFE